MIPDALAMVKSKASAPPPMDDNGHGLSFALTEVQKEALKDGKMVWHVPTDGNQSAGCSWFAGGILIIMGISFLFSSEAAWQYFGICMIILSFVAMIIGCTQMGDLYVIFDDASQKIYLGKGIEKGVEQVTTHLGMYKDFHGAELKEWLDDGSVVIEIRFMFTSGPQGNGSRSGA